MPNGQCSVNQLPYRVQAGDTLYVIAIRYGTTVSNIIAANPGIDPYRLRIGQTLCIPVCPTAHTVRIIQPGDSFYKIAQEYRTSITAIAAANPGINPNLLRVGQLLCIPSVCPAGYTSYTVRNGETLYAIAGRYFTTVQALLTTNPGIVNPNALTVGQKICVPFISAIRRQLSMMTLDEKIGQMLIVGFNSPSVDQVAWTLIRGYHVGGIIVYGYNVQNTSQLLALMNTLKRTNSTNKVPLFLSVDEEGGRVSRMPAAFLNLPSNAVIGRVNNPNLSYQIGNVIANQIKAFGFNMDFAPVLDINSNPANPVIGDRSFGATPQIVSRLGVQTMKGLQAGGVIPVAKHFPGHGDTSVDSHIGLPAVNHDLSRLESFEFIPFSDAIRNQADAIMIAHILLTRIDPVNPSSMSKILITDILREQLGFSGVVITDDMAMGAIVKNFDIGNAAVKSINAGADIILVSGDYANQIKIINALKSAVENGVIRPDRIDESVYRILKLKNNYSLRDTILTTVDVNQINDAIRAVLQQM